MLVLWVMRRSQSATNITHRYIFLAINITIRYIIPMHTIIYTKSAQQSLKNMQPAKAAQILEKVGHIARDPYGAHNNVTKLQGRDGYRLRVGDWRVLYTINNDQLVLLVVDVLPRGDAYKH